MYMYICICVHIDTYTYKHNEMYIYICMYTCISAHYRSLSGRQFRFYYDEGSLFVSRPICQGIFASCAGWSVSSVAGSGWLSKPAMLGGGRFGADRACEFVSGQGNNSKTVPYTYICTYIHIQYMKGSRPYGNALFLHGKVPPILLIWRPFYR